MVVLRDAGHGEAVDFAARAVGQVDDNNGDSLCRREREGIQLFRRLVWIGKDNGRAFARIDGLPPPMQSTALASADLPRAAASSMESVVGLGVTLSYREMRMPCLAQAAVT